MTEEVSREHPDKSISVEFMPLDLASLRSVKRFTEDYKQKGLPLHLLINNAGIGSVPFGECPSWFGQGHCDSSDSGVCLLQTRHTQNCACPVHLLCDGLGLSPVMCMLATLYTFIIRLCFI